MPQNLPVRIDETGRLPRRPSAGPVVDISGSLALCAAVRVTIDLGEEQRALLLEEVSIDRPRDESRLAFWRSAVSR